jgi:hypothetical protein
MDFKYQLAVIGPGPARHRSSILRSVRSALKKLKVETSAFHVIKKASQINKRNSVAAVWLGEEGQAGTEEDNKILDKLLQEGMAIIPAVDDLDGVTKKVPEIIKHINATKREPEINVVQAVLRCLGLTRIQRQAFITYKRSDSTGVAIQIFDGLSERGFHTFLDTASIEIGDNFQAMLWDRISDADVHLFLDTPNALKSPWICEELARVNGLGLGVVQVVWPGHQPTPGTEFSVCSRFQLATTDFEDGIASNMGRLKNDVVEKIMILVEQSRISSLGLRRIDVIGELQVQAAEQNYKAVVQPTGLVELMDVNTCIAVAFPVVGLPDAWSIHQLEVAWRKHRTDWQKDKHIKVVYNGLGMRPDRQVHLVWLNESLRLKTVTLDGLPQWWGELKGGTP